MPIEQPNEQEVRLDSAPGECRRCRTFCDRMIEPRDCIAIGCRYVYSHEDNFTGTQYIGCMRRVYSGEVALDALRAPGGLGGIKVTGQMLPQCQFRVEQAYVGEGDAFDCVNRRFFDCDDDGPEGLRAFDLRDGLENRAGTK